MLCHKVYGIKKGGRFWNRALVFWKKTSLLVISFSLMIAVFAVSDVFAVCGYFSSGDFGSGSGWTAEQGTADWTIYNGMVDVQVTGSVASYAQHQFTPSGFFTLDVDVNIVAAGGEYGRLGVYVYSNAHSPFTIGGYSTDGVVGYYYPDTGLVRFKFYDFNTGKWVVVKGSSVSGAVHSIGLSLLSDRVVFRVNGQDTNDRLLGDFASVSKIDTLELRAGGAGLHARFDNICASAPGDTMALPDGRELLTVSSAASPVVSTNPAQANPFGFGAAAAGGKLLSLNIGLSNLAGPVDIYLGIKIGSGIYLFSEDNHLHPVADGLVCWRSHSVGGIDALIMSNIDMTNYPGTYKFYLLMVPSGRFDVFRQWTTSLVVGGGSSSVTDKAMEQEIRHYLDLVFSLSSKASKGSLNELTTIFSDKNVVTTSPAKLDLQSLNAGTPITVVADFGSGYTMKSGSVMKGNARIVISNIQFDKSGMGADFSGTFNNVVKDGIPFANGQVSGGLHMVMNADGGSDSGNTRITGQIVFTDLQLEGHRQSGSIQVAGTLQNTELNDDEDEFVMKLRQTFSDFTSGSNTIYSGYADIDSTTRGSSLFQPKSGSSTITTNLQSSEGPIQMTMRLIVGDNGLMTLATTVPGTMGAYTVNINDVTLDVNKCPNYPTGGNISFTKSGGPTGVVTFVEACGSGYQYSER